MEKSPHMERLESERLGLEQDNVKLRSKCRFLESSLQDGLETLRTRDLQLARVEVEHEKTEVALAAAVKRLEAEKSGLRTKITFHKDINFTCSFQNAS